MSEQISFLNDFRGEQNSGEKKSGAADRLRKLISLLNDASYAYYQKAEEIMSDHEYDALYDELLALEEASGIVFSDSPTQNVGYEVLSELPKEAHSKKMLSLDKTKDVDSLVSFVGDEEAVLSWKLDGLTVVLTYRDGRLEKAVTRGNGEVGEVVTNNAKTFSNIPLTIEYKGELVVRGEAVITYPDFEKINAEIGDEALKYKNPRNLCSGSVRQLDPAVTKSRRVRFFAFSLVSAGEPTDESLNRSSGEEQVKKHKERDGDRAGDAQSERRESAPYLRFRSEQLEWLGKQGFATVFYEKVDAGSVRDAVSRFSKKVAENPVPSDGLVLSLNDIEYGRSLGSTAKFPRDSIAFKWKDETAETVLREIEWSASRTGLINPIAIFDPVELEGTTVSRASLHNVSIMQALELGIGDRISVYKANMIIPQIAENFTRSGNAELPAVCPVCGATAIKKEENGVATMNCPNDECTAKRLKGFAHFVSRDAMNIDGLSEMTLEKLINKGLIRELADIFHIGDFHDEIVETEGFGELSFRNLKTAVDNARRPGVQAFLYALGIPNFGRANAGLVAKYCRNRWESIRNLTKEELMTIDGIGEIMADSYTAFFSDAKNVETVDRLLEEIEIDESFSAEGDKLSGLTFVITGSLGTYSNRDELKAEIEANGGKVAGSVSAKTSYLINNDVSSTSGKNKKARELGINIISEQEYKELFSR